MDARSQPGRQNHVPTMQQTEKDFLIDPMQAGSLVLLQKFKETQTQRLGAPTTLDHIHCMQVQLRLVVHWQRKGQQHQGEEAAAEGPTLARQNNNSPPV